MSRPIVRPRAARFVALVLAVACASLVACAPDDVPEPSAFASTSSAIVGGVKESGWQGVGALTLRYPGAGYIGSFCTGTLIAPQWVLTAAHCVLSNDEMEVSPPLVSFFVGLDANPTWGGGTPAGSFYQTDVFYPHPYYSGEQDTDHDIALVHLESPATGVATYPISTTAFNGSFVDVEAFFVGYGATEGINQTGSGIKRSASVPIYSYDEYFFITQYDGSGTCFGDSGGPAFLSIDGKTSVVGVNSSVGGEDADPCKGFYFAVRVDAYAPWIADLLGQTLPSCKTKPDMCFCASACLSTGKCDNTKCKTKTCEEAYECMTGCADSDSGCQVDCYNSATVEGGQLMDAMFGCFQDQCGTASDFQTCATSKCATQIAACMPAANCPLAGGGCSAGTACYPIGDGQTDCFPSDGLSEGATCNPSLSDRLACGDGLVCLGTILAKCQKLCATDVDCGANRQCNKAIFAGYPDIGTCGCKDADKDGACADKDCNDNDKSIKPGAAEKCGNTVDDDCDGSTDEDCATCTDADKDGACVPADCDDGKATVHPGAAEACGNQIDDDCDGATDEDCTTCTDADGDEYCAGDDCDDGNVNVNPGVAEVCGNATDDNCNGGTDEGCAACTDSDGDGFCPPQDCDDTNAAAQPGVPELCFNGFDDDCDGVIDEDCPACPDADGDGACTADDCDDGNAAVFPGATEVCNSIDDDCDGTADEECVPPDGEDATGETDVGGTSTAGKGGLCTMSPAGAPLSGMLLPLAMLGMALRSRRRRP